MDTLAFAHARSGQLPRALEIQKQVVDMSRTSPVWPNSAQASRRTKKWRNCCGSSDREGALKARFAVAAAAALLLWGCGSAPLRDGPDPRPPPGLERTPDATPRVEPIREGGPNKPYHVAGRGYMPMTRDQPFAEAGLASWYGRKFHGRPTASGEPYDMYAMTAAHRTMPIPSYARVRNPANGREVIVRINDRGPFAEGRVIDLSYVAALKLGVLGGVANVQVQRITWAEIRESAP